MRHFFLTDQVEKGNLTILCCPTGEMIADYMSKPLQGAKFEQFRKDIVGFEDVCMFRPAEAGVCCVISAHGETLTI